MNALPLPVFGRLLFAALLNASWNALVKSASDKLLTTIMITGSASVISAIALPWLTAPAAASWSFILASVCLQVAYYLMVTLAYRLADMSLVYPLMRGTAPLLLALSSAALLGERLSVNGWLGVALLCGGIFGFAAGSRGQGRKGVYVALVTALLIPGYTLVDGLGARRSGAPVAYTLWTELLAALPLSFWALKYRRQAFGRCLARQWHLGLIVGLGTLMSYSVALWAMTQAPVVAVAALRETSILFAVRIALFVLRERVSPARLLAVVLIAAGAALLRLA